VRIRQLWLLRSRASRDEGWGKRRESDCDAVADWDCGEACKKHEGDVIFASLRLKRTRMEFCDLRIG
jgi:hypothetical protein